MLEARLMTTNIKATENNSVILSAALRLDEEWKRYCDADNGITKESSETNNRIREQIKDTSMAAQEAAQDTIMAAKANNAIEAAIQLTQACFSLERLASPGPGVNIRETHAQIERCLYSAYNILVETADIDPKKYGTDSWMREIDDPFIGLPNQT
jgi:hypothetical protein